MTARASSRCGSAYRVPSGWSARRHSYVLRVTRANTVEQLDVTPGAGMADAVEVRGPLAPGDRLVVRGGERLAAGEAVRVIDPGARGAQTPPGLGPSGQDVRRCRRPGSVSRGSPRARLLPP